MSQSQNAPSEWANGKIVFADAGQFAAYLSEAQVGTQLSEAQLTQIATVVGNVVAEVIRQAGEPAAPEPKAQTRKTEPKARKAPRKAEPKARKVKLDNGHTVVFDNGKARKHPATGWLLDGNITSFDGFAITDNWTADGTGRSVPDLGNVNGLMPCRKAGCSETRHRQNMFCRDHRAMARDAGKCWKHFGKPKVGSPEYAEYFGLLAETSPDITDA